MQNQDSVKVFLENSIGTVVEFGTSLESFEINTLKEFNLFITSGEKAVPNKKALEDLAQEL